MEKKAKSAEGQDLTADASNYDKDAYEKPAVTVDIGVLAPINCVMSILLIQRKNPPHRGCWALPGGFVDIAKKETLLQAAQRELKEETGLNEYTMQQGRAYGDPGRDPRMRIITIVYYTVVSSNCVEKTKAGDDATEAKWFSLHKLPKVAFDHETIIKDIAKDVMGSTYEI